MPQQVGGIRIAFDLLPRFSSEFLRPLIFTQSLAIRRINIDIRTDSTSLVTQANKIIMLMRKAIAGNGCWMTAICVKISKEKVLWHIPPQVGQHFKLILSSSIKNAVAAAFHLSPRLVEG